MFCPNCGKENSPFAKFCESCGATIPDMNDAQGMQQGAPQQPMYGNDQPQQQMFGGQQPMYGNGQPQQQMFGGQQPMYGNGQPQQQMFGGQMGQQLMNGAQQAVQPFQQSNQPYGGQPSFRQSMPSEQQPFQQPMGMGSVPPAQPMTFDSTAPAQPMTYSGTDGADSMPTSRYQEFDMSDVIAEKRKRNKKIIKIVLIVLITITLIVAGILIFRFIKHSMTKSKIQEAPTAYLLESYEKTSDALASQEEALKILHNTSSGQQTTRTSIKYNGKTVMDTVTAIDTEKRQFYYSQTQNGSALSSSGLGTSGLGGSGDTKIELYSNVDTHVAKYTANGKSVDFCLNSSTLREDIGSSIFSPTKDNVLNIQQGQLDTFLDVHDYVYKNLKKSDDEAFGLKAFKDKLVKDMDKYAEVSEEKTDILGKNEKAFVIKHSFKDAQALNTIYADFKDWAKQNLSINSQIDESIDQAIEQMDPMKYQNYLNQSKFEITLKNYINRDNGLIMKTELIVDVAGQKGTFSMTYGKDPYKSNKYAIDLKVEAGVTVEENITIERKSDNDLVKYEATLTGPLSGTITYSRNKSSGDFELNSDLKNTMESLTSGSSLGSLSGLTNVSTASSGLSVNPMGNSLIPTLTTGKVTRKGNLKVDGHRVTFYIQDTTSGSSTITEMSISDYAEITELSSSNDILKMSKDDIVNKVSEAFPEIGMLLEAQKKQSSGTTTNPSGSLKIDGSTGSGSTKKYTTTRVI